MYAAIAREVMARNPRAKFVRESDVTKRLRAQEARVQRTEKHEEPPMLEVMPDGLRASQIQETSVT